jgi:ABC-2 type transport system ATP-binding protein
VRAYVLAGQKAGTGAVRGAGQLGDAANLFSQASSFASALREGYRGSHILPEVRQTCDRVLVLRKGRIVYAGAERDLHSHGEGHLVRVGVRGESAALLGLLRSMPQVRSATLEGEADGIVDVLVNLTGDQRAELIAALVGAGQRVRRVEDARDDLEQTFLDLTREGAA